MEIMEAIRRGGEEAHEAAMTLGLLIERRTVNRPAGDDGGIRAVLGDQLANLTLSDAELQTAVDELIRYLDETPGPFPGAVWALNKSYDPRAVPHLLRLLDRTLTDPNNEHVAYQALQGIITTGVPSQHKDQSLAAIQRAAAQGHGEVKASAADYLKLFSKGSTPE
jgi:hypothetical protein